MNKLRGLLYFLLGLALLVATVIGIALIARGPLFPETTSSLKEPPKDRSEVVCVGFADVMGGIRSLYPLQSGRVASVCVHEGQQVSQGQVLLTLDDSRARSRVAAQRHAITIAQTMLEHAELAKLQHPIRVRQQQAAVAAARERLSAAKNLLARKRQLLANRLVNEQEVAAAQDSVQALEAIHRAEKEKLAEVQLLDLEIAVRRAVAEVAAARAQLNEAKQALADYALKAPEAGEILRIFAGPGDVFTAQARRPAMEFCPARPRLVRAEVAQEFADRVRVGQAAVVTDYVTRMPRWKGRVTRLSDWYTQRRPILEDPLQPKDIRSLECIVVLDPGQDMHLRIGQRMLVTLLSAPD